MSVRKVLFWIHLAGGVAASVIILIMSVTGVLLTYQRQMTAWADMRSYRADPPAPGAARLPVEAMVAKAAAQRTGDAPMTVTLRSDPRAPASVALGQRTLFVNPYTGDVLGEGAPGVRAFFRSVTDWHRWLAAPAANRATARGITGASNLAFLIIVVSGPFLWWPKRVTWTQVRNIAWFRAGLSPKARDFNWHNVLGIWSVVPLVVIVGSGVVISYPWAGNLVYRVYGEQPPVQAGRGGVEGGRGGRGGEAARAGRGEVVPGGRGGRESGATAGVNEPALRADGATVPSGAERPAASATAGPRFDAMIATAAALRPSWRTIALRLPAPRGPIALTVDEGDGGQPQKRGTVTLDAATGAVVRWDGPAELSAGRRARSWLRFAHTGEVYGLVGQTVAGLASLAGAVLVYTGIALAFRRWLAWWRRRNTLMSRAEESRTAA